jgi:hypothetical protein
MHDSQIGLSLLRAKYCLTPDQINRKWEWGRTNTIAPETLTRIEPEAKPNFTQVVEKQIETSKRRIRVISGETNQGLNENFPSQIREETTPEAEQEISSESGGLEEILNLGIKGEFGEEESSGSEFGEGKSTGGVEVGEK